MYGRGIYIDSGTLTATGVTGVTGNDNTTTNDGGTIYVYDDTLTVSNSAFDGNTVDDDDDGGAIFGWYDVIVSDSTFTDNQSDDDGGAVYSYDGDITVTGSTFTDNEATGGSGGGIWGELDIEVANSTFTDNQAEEYGAGIYSDEGDAAVTSSRFTGGIAEYAGAINIEEGALLIDDSYFADNSSVDEGGAVWVDTDATIVGSTFKNNESEDDGGAINADGDLAITDSIFIDNRADGDGGAAHTDGELTISGSSFSDNSADDGGAASSSGITTIASSTFTDNTALDDGGALDGNGSSSTLTITNSTFNGNATHDDPDADDDDVQLGGILFVKNGDATLRFTTFADNTSESGGGSVTIETGSLNSQGTVISGTGSPCLLADPATTASSWSYASTDDSCGFTSDNDEEGADAATFDELADNGGATLTRMPAAGSDVRAAIAATACAALTGDLATDQRGQPRPSVAGARCDIGAVNTTSITPSAPSSVVLTPDSSGETATLTWSAPADDGGADVLGFFVEYSLDGVTFIRMPDTTGLATNPDARSLTVPMPPAGATIYYRVGAVNVVGTGVAGARLPRRSRSRPPRRRRRRRPRWQSPAPRGARLPKLGCRCWRSVC